MLVNTVLHKSLLVAAIKQPFHYHRHSPIVRLSMSTIEVPKSPKMPGYPTCETDLVSGQPEKVTGKVVSTMAEYKTRLLYFEGMSAIGLLQAVAQWHADILQPLTLPAYFICHTFGSPCSEG